MSVEDMAKISETLDGVLDSVEFLDDYMLEISSPGINRVFKHKNEFDIFKGLEVKVQTADGEKFIGECGGIDGENVILQNVETDEGKQNIVINLANISKAKLFG
jgi:ribosome maturation factor RimP